MILPANGLSSPVTSQKFGKINMNNDHIILAMLILGGAVGYVFGYWKGHEHGKIAGRIAYRKAQRSLEQVGR